MFKAFSVETYYKVILVLFLCSTGVALLVPIGQAVATDVQDRFYWVRTISIHLLGLSLPLIGITFVAYLFENLYLSLPMAFLVYVSYRGFTLDWRESLFMKYPLIPYQELFLGIFFVGLFFFFRKVGRIERS